jgi:PadR family transcriptional regulator, regulatory protein PadR
MAEYIAKRGSEKSNGRSPEPWEAQLRKGSLEMAILASLWTNKQYGLEILRTLDGKSSLALAEGTLYLILNRLKNDELVGSEWVDAGTGHPRKYYWLTKAGKERLRAMARFWTEFSTNLDALLNPVLDREEKRSAQQ